MGEVALRMPKMSMTMAEGELLTWHVAAGDVVEAGQVVCDVQTDKVDMEVEAPASGTLARTVADEGAVVAVGEPLAWIDTEAEDLLAGVLDDPDGTRAGTVPAAPDPADADDSPDRGAEPPSRHGADVPALPGARRLAARHGVDLAALRGSGPGGAVIFADVQRAVPQSPEQPPDEPSDQTSDQTSERAPQRPESSPAADRPDRRAAVRARVAELMTRSAAVPQFTVSRDLDLAAAARDRAVSWTTLLVAGFAAALRDSPLGGPDEVALGLAVDTPYGLVAPTVADPDRLDLDALDALLKRVADRARRGKVDQAHLAPATATLSNLGGLGVDRFAALLTPPQASALAVGAVGRRVIATEQGITTRLRCTVGLTVDHRVADGADAARLLADINAWLAAR